MGYVVQGGTSVLQNRLMWAYVSYPSSPYVLQSGPRSLLRALVLQWTISRKRSCDTKGEANIFYLPKKNNFYMLQSYDMWTKSKSHQYFNRPFINMNTTVVHYIGHQDSAHIGVIKSWCPIYWTQINDNKQSLIYKGWLSESFRNLFYRTQTLKLAGIDNSHRQFVLVTLTLWDLVLSDRHNGCHIGLTGCHRKADFIPNLWKSIVEVLI